MADKKKLNETLSEDLKGIYDSLTDEQLNEVAGGYVRSTVKRPTEWDTCYLCQQRKNVDDMMYTVIKGERRHVCCKCMGVR